MAEEETYLSHHLTEISTRIQVSKITHSKVPPIHKRHNHSVREPRAPKADAKTKMYRGGSCRSFQILDLGINMLEMEGSGGK